jgi:membrane-bound ClpP family serine protease
MCHVLLILPLLALPVFWIWPLSAALPVYGVVLGLSAWIYWYAIRAMRQPKQNGAEGMIGETGQIVVSDLGELHMQVRSELWDAFSTVPVRQGDRVKVVAADGTRLRVAKLEARATPTGARAYVRAQSTEGGR